MVKLAYCNDGESVYDFFFLQHLAKNNSVYLLTFNKNPRQVPKGVRVVEMREPFHPTDSPIRGLFPYLSSFLRSFLLKTHLAKAKPDVSIGCGALFYGFYTALSGCSPCILFVWGSDVVIYSRQLPFRFIAKYALKKANAVVVDSDIQEKACIDLGCDPKKIVKFPWVDFQSALRHAEKEADCGRSADELREKFGWRKDDPVIISTRHHEPIYEVELLIRAIPDVIKAVPTVRFLILGKGSLTEKLKKSAATLGVSSSVKFLGQVAFSDVPKYLKMADIYVSTSLSDGTSASLIEAMACKIPVVVTGIPGNREWVTDGSNGLLFPVRDSKALVERILMLLNDEDLRKSLTNKAYKTVSEKADWQKNSQILDNLISSMVTLK